MTVRWISGDGRVRLWATEDGLYLSTGGREYQLDDAAREVFLLALGIDPRKLKTTAQVELNRLDAWMAQHMPGAVGEDGAVSSVIRLLEAVHTFVASAYPIASNIASQTISGGQGFQGFKPFADAVQALSQPQWADLVEDPHVPEGTMVMGVVEEVLSASIGTHVRGDDGQVRVVGDVGRCVVCTLTTDQCDVTGCNGRRGEGWRTAKRNKLRD